MPIFNQIPHPPPPTTQRLAVITRMLMKFAYLAATKFRNQSQDSRSIKSECDFKNREILINAVYNVEKNKVRLTHILFYFMCDYFDKKILCWQINNPELSTPDQPLCLFF